MLIRQCANVPMKQCDNLKMWQFENVKMNVGIDFIFE
jgi:hypothetical protein